MPSEFPLPTPPATLSHGPVRLHFVKIIPGDNSRGFAPSYHFRIMAGDLDTGHINFRVGDSIHVEMCAGHVGYEIAEAFRGRHFAYHACQALAPFIREVMGTVVITSDPENHPSIRTIVRLGATFLEEVVVPLDDPHYARGSRTKLRYKWSPGPGLEPS
jgi:tagatose 1,6-diphosphate aldolase